MYFREFDPYHLLNNHYHLCLYFTKENRRELRSKWLGSVFQNRKNVNLPFEKIFSHIIDDSVNSFNILVSTFC